MSLPARAPMATLYSPGQRRALSLTPVILLGVLAYLHFHPYPYPLDTCSINRVLTKPPPPLIPLPDSALHNYSVLSIWLSMILLLLLPSSSSFSPPSSTPRPSLSSLFALLYTALWFHVTYILLCALKAPLGDFNCAGRHPFYPNGVSGHYCYFIFVTLSAPHLARVLLSSSTFAPRFLTLPSAAFATFYAIGAPATLYRTYAHGYHSPRQIVLGSALGIASHAALEAFFLGDPDRFSRSATLAVLASASAAALGLYRALWPLSTAGPALTSGHVYFHAGMWAALLSTHALELLFRPRTARKIAVA